MPAICLHLDLHLPVILKGLALFDLGKGGPYFDHTARVESGKRFVQHTLLPCTQVLEDLLTRYEGRYKLAFSVSGTSLDLFESHLPEGLEALQRLSQTGHVEWLNSPYYHSLSWLFDRKEFGRQLTLQRQRIEELFDQRPQILCNTHLIYNNYLAYFAGMNGYRGILCEGVPRLMSRGIENELCRPTDSQQISLLLRNAQLSEDLSLRFSDIAWEHQPLSPKTYAQWLAQAPGSVVVLSMDFNVFERQASHGILNFFKQLPEMLFEWEDTRFVLPTEVCDSFSPKGVYDVMDTISWDWPHRDTRNWQSNPMQLEGLEKVYALSELVQSHEQGDHLDTWAALQSAEIFFQMVENSNPGPEFAGSPYAQYARFMNTLADFQLKLSP